MIVVGIKCRWRKVWKIGKNKVVMGVGTFGFTIWEA